MLPAGFMLTSSDMNLHSRNNPTSQHAQPNLQLKGVTRSLPANKFSLPMVACFYRTLSASQDLMEAPLVPSEHCCIVAGADESLIMSFPM